MTAFTTETDFAHLADSVLDTSLPRAEWTHEAHFALALEILRHRPDLAGGDSFRSIITRLNEAHGTPNTDSSGYHHTITLASLGATERLLDARRGAPLAEVLREAMAGPLGRSDWILAHWSRDRLFSVEARRGWVEPDLAPLL
ncbi:hypothetical protein GRI42_07155 [Erythrobacter gaetbuli]|uniref:Uncharacterized protein n=1 Tax=Qipengyuania gaetbuli TaxID=266952 RepID=A0A844Y1T5_9SPHN|nr:hypothetical protein [Qipengyuania gaetbuli]MXO51078.1 hypothetical protein [Qipengyuania gaetbuli]